MDPDGASAYLDDAAKIAGRRSLHTPLMLGEINLVRCWTSLLAGNFPFAQQASRVVNRAFQGASDSTAIWARIGVRLATFRGKRGREENRDFLRLKASIGSRAFYPTEHLSLAALLLYSKQTDEFEGMCNLATRQVPRIESTGKNMWPFVLSHLK